MTSHPSDEGLIAECVWLLIRHTGSYDDYRTTPIAAYAAADLAEHARATASAEWRAATNGLPERDHPEDDASATEWDEWERARLGDYADFAARLSVDPKGAPTSSLFGPDEPEYSVSAVPFFTALKGNPHV